MSGVETIGPEIIEHIFDGIGEQDGVKPGDLLAVKGLSSHRFWSQGIIVALLPGNKAQMLVDKNSISTNQ